MGCTCLYGSKFSTKEPQTPLHGMTRTKPSVFSGPEDIVHKNAIDDGGWEHTDVQ